MESSGRSLWLSEGRSGRKLRIKLSPGVRNLCSKWAAIAYATWRRDFRNHSLSLVILRNKVVIRIPLRSPFQFVIGQRGVDDEYCCFGGTDPGVRRNWVGRSYKACFSTSELARDGADTSSVVNLQ